MRPRGARAGSGRHGFPITSRAGFFPPWKAAVWNAGLWKWGDISLNMAIARW